MFEIFGRLPTVAQPFRRQTKPGDEPGIVVVNPESTEPTIEIICYDAESIIEQKVDQPPYTIERVAGKTTWINVDGLGSAEAIRTLGREFGLHPLTLEDVVHIHQRAKVEDYQDYLFIVARMAVLETSLATEQLSLFLGPDFVLTFQEGRPGDCLEPVRRRLRHAQGQIRKCGADYLAYAILDAVVDAYFPILEYYGDQLDELDAILLDNQSSQSISQVHQVRSELAHLRRSIWPHREAIGQLARSTHALISDTTRVYFRDTLDHTHQLIDVLESYRELCAHLNDLFYSAISIRTNEVVKVLTIISTVFMPLSFLAGVYGMNFEHMPELKWRLGYPLILALMGGIAAALLGFVWKRGWLRM